MIKFSECKTEQDFEQFYTIKDWCNNGYKGTYIGTTGCGKTRIGTEVVGITLERNLNASALIVVPTINLRDNEWENDIKKWGYEGIRNRITIECNQTAFKRKNDYYDILVIDEAHTIVTEEFIKILKNNQFEKILCLSATIPKDKLDILNRFAPVFRILTLENALDKGIVCNFNIYNLGLDFNEQDRKNYDKYSEAITNIFPIFDNSLDKIYGFTKNPESLKRYCNSNGLYLSETARDLKYIRESINNRYELLYSNITKIDITKQILNKFNKKKTIVFTERQHMIEEIKEELKKSRRSITLYHSKLKKKEKILALQDFKEHNTSVLLAVKALNLGLDVPECSFGILVSGTGSIVDFPQRLGRLLRYEDNKKATLIQLYMKNTKEETWMRKRMEKIPKNNIVLINNITEICL